MWDLPAPENKPASPALAVRFFTTEPPGGMKTPKGVYGKVSFAVE